MARKNADAEAAASADDIIELLDGLDAPDLARVVQRAQELRAEKLEAAREAFIARVREEAAALELDPTDLFGRPAPARKGSGSRGKSRGVVPAQFRSPDGVEWSGRGKAPRWLAALEAQGHSRDDFRLEGPLEAIARSFRGRP